MSSAYGLKLLQAAEDTLENPGKHSLLSAMELENLIIWGEWGEWFPHPYLPSKEIYFMLACFCLLYLEEEF